MTEPVGVVTLAPESAATVHEALAATLAHVALLRDKQATLRGAQVAAEEQVLHSAGRMYGAGEMDDAALHAFYEAYAAVALPGYSKRWTASVPKSAARMQNERARMRGAARHAPNMPDGTWRGTVPIGLSGIPYDGVPVVYVLYDADSVPCYVGSSAHLRGRLQWHEREGKPFSAWTASRCDDREAAYQLEDRLLNEYKPYLNKRRGR